MSASKSIVETLTELGACAEGMEWASRFGTDWNRLWTEGQRGDYFLWLLSKTVVPDKRTSLACALDCALLGQSLWPANHREEMEKAVSVLRSWIAGSASDKEASEAAENLHEIWRRAAKDGSSNSRLTCCAVATAAEGTIEGAMSAIKSISKTASTDAAKESLWAASAKIVRRYFPKVPV